MMTLQIWMMLSLAFVLGGIAGITYAMRATIRHIDRADIRSDDKRFIRGVLGIQQNGERK